MQLDTRRYVEHSNILFKQYKHTGTQNTGILKFSTDHTVRIFVISSKINAGFSWVRVRAETDSEFTIWIS